MSTRPPLGNRRRKNPSKFFEAFDEGDDGVGGDGDDDEGSSNSNSNSNSFQSLENLVKLAQKVADESEYAREGTSRASDGMPGRAMDASDDDWDEIDFSGDFESEEEENTMWESISQSGAITNECGHGESKEYSLCFKIDEESKSESVSRQATTVPGTSSAPLIGPRLPWMRCRMVMVTVAIESQVEVTKIVKLY